MRHFLITIPPAAASDRRSESSRVRVVRGVALGEEVRSPRVRRVIVPSTGRLPKEDFVGGFVDSVNTRVNSLLAGSRCAVRNISEILSTFTCYCQIGSLRWR